MRKRSTKTLFAVCMCFTMLVAGIGSTVSVQSSAATDDNTSLTKVLGADDLKDLRFKWDDTSNIGPVREVTIAGRTEQGTLKVKDNGLMRNDIPPFRTLYNTMSYHA